jgi:ubiquinone/menaquinone biosynthesis C-methylase UbiE
MRGNVLDVGGKKTERRGEFRPPMGQVASWKYVNIDASTSPDFCCSAENIPLADGSIDTVLLCEVLEHLEDPEKVLRECRRILKPEGNLVASMPFLFPVHADPYDFQRWTGVKLGKIIEKIGYIDIEVQAMGGIGSVVHDLLFVASLRAHGRYIRKFAETSLSVAKPLLRYLDTKSETIQASVTTGYFILARKQRI